jgi:uncharacterized protein YecT (DUF1311 family)
MKHILVLFAGLVLVTASAGSASAQATLSPAHKQCLDRITGAGNIVLTNKMAACAKAELARQTARMTKVMARLMKDPTKVAGVHRYPDAAASRKGLRAAQKSWASFRNRQCTWYGRQWARGFDSELASVICMARLTKQRADWLTQIAP